MWFICGIHSSFYLLRGPTECFFTQFKNYCSLLLGKKSKSNVNLPEYFCYTSKYYTYTRKDLKKKIIWCEFSFYQGLQVFVNSICSLLQKLYWISLLMKEFKQVSFYDLCNTTSMMCPVWLFFLKKTWYPSFIFNDITLRSLDTQKTWKPSFTQVILQ